MKRLLLPVFLMLVLALSGCSGTAAQEAASSAANTVNTSASESAAQQTTPDPEPAVTAEAAAAETELSAVEASTAPESVPETSAAEERSPESLRDLLPIGPTVSADGIILESLYADSLTLVPDTALMEVYPWLQRTTDGEYPVYTDRSGNPVTLNWSTAEGDDYVYPGSGAVCFAGETPEYWLPLRQMTELLGLNLLWDGEWQEAFVSDPVNTAEIETGVSIPVLMYHETSDDIWGIESLFVSPDNLRQQLQYLQDNGYDPIFFSDLTHLEDYDKPVLITCDDGYIGNYTYLYPLLQEFHMKATIFVIANMVGSENYMTAQQLKELSDSGLVDIESHTENHYQLATLSAEDQRFEMEQSRLDIARLTGRVPYVLAYPNGSNDANTRTIGPEYYTFGILMNGGIWTTGGDWFGVTRSYVNRSTDLAGFAALLG